MKKQVKWISFILIATILMLAGCSKEPTLTKEDVLMAFNESNVPLTIQKNDIPKHKKAINDIYAHLPEFEKNKESIHILIFKNEKQRLVEQNAKTKGMTNEIPHMDTGVANVLIQYVNSDDIRTSKWAYVDEVFDALKQLKEKIEKSK